jgi:hypothetical protein
VGRSPFITIIGLTTPPELLQGHAVAACCASFPSSFLFRGALSAVGHRWSFREGGVVGSARVCQTVAMLPMADGTERRTAVAGFAYHLSVLDPVRRLGVAQTDTPGAGRTVVGLAGQGQHGGTSGHGSPGPVVPR